MSINEEPEVFLGLDVGKEHHWACALTRQGEVLWNKALPNDEGRLVEVFNRLQKHG